LTSSSREGDQEATSLGESRELGGLEPFWRSVTSATSIDTSIGFILVIITIPIPIEDVGGEILVWCKRSEVAALLYWDKWSVLGFNILRMSEMTAVADCRFSS
jgi:hypothetical protein